MPRVTKSVEDRIAEVDAMVASILELDGKGADDGDLAHVSFGSKEQTLRLQGSGARLWHKLVRRVERFVSKGNETKWVENALRDLSLSAKTDPSQRLTLVTELVRRALAPADLHEVLLPVYGLTLVMPSLVIGDVCIMNPAVTARKLEEATRDDARFTDNDMFKQWADEFSHLPTAIVPVYGDANVSERAMQELEPVLDFLRFIGGGRNTSPISPWPVGLGHWRTVGIIRNGSVAPSRHREPLGPLVVNDKALEYFTEKGLLQFAEALKSEYQKTEFEQCIVTSMHWLSNAEDQFRREGRLLCYVSALDGFFTERGAPIGRIVGEGVAFFLSDDPSHRYYYYRFVDECYGKRNALAHGKRAIVADQDLEQLSQIVREFIGQAIRERDKFSTAKDFKDWVFFKRFSLPEQ